MKRQTEIHGDAIATAIGDSATSIARDVTVFKSHIERSRLDPHLKDTLLLARAEVDRLPLPRVDKEDLIDDFAKFTRELESSEHNQTRIQRLWGRIQEIAPTIAALLRSAESIAKLLAPS